MTRPKRSPQSVVSPVGNHNATDVIQGMKLCKPVCPVFDQCPLMPLAVQPKDPRVRHCLVNNGPIEMRRAYRNLFMKGRSGVIEELRTWILEYGRILRDEGKKEFTLKEKMRYLKDLTGMLLNLGKLLGPMETEDGGNDDDDTVVIDAGEDEIPDPESLANSPLVQEMLKGNPDQLEAMPVPKPVEKEPVPDLIKQFFPEDGD